MNESTAQLEQTHRDSYHHDDQSGGHGAIQIEAAPVYLELPNKNGGAKRSMTPNFSNKGSDAEGRSESPHSMASNASMMSFNNNSRAAKQGHFSLQLFQMKRHMFTFDKLIPQGQYEFPFTLRLPGGKEGLPPSYSVTLSTGETYSIAYKLTMYFDSDEPVLQHSIPIVIVRRASTQLANPLIRQQTSRMIIEDTSSGLISQNHLPGNQKGGGGDCLTDRYHSDRNPVNVAPAETLQIM